MAELHTDEFLELRSSTEESKWPCNGITRYPAFGIIKQQSQTGPNSFLIKYTSKETKLFFFQVHYVLYH